MSGADRTVYKHSVLHNPSPGRCGDSLCCRSEAGAVGAEWAGERHGQPGQRPGQAHRVRRADVDDRPDSVEMFIDRPHLPLTPPPQLENNTF